METLVLFMHLSDQHKRNPGYNPIAGRNRQAIISRGPVRPRLLSLFHIISACTEDY